MLWRAVNTMHENEQQVEQIENVSPASGITTSRVWQEAVGSRYRVYESYQMADLFKKIKGMVYVLND